MRWRALALGSLLVSSSAAAFTFETTATRGCHEELTLFAADHAPWPSGRAPPQVTREDRSLARNVPFSVRAEVDRWTLSMLIGVRDNDTGGFALTDLPELAGVHNGSDLQDAHCLRSPSQDYEGGDTSALEACRAFIQGEIDKAVGPGLHPDFEATIDVPVELRFQRANVKVSRYAFHLGRALHALQDSYSHSYRKEAGGVVVAVLNYVEPTLAAGFDVLRDGPPHLGVLDRCDGKTSFDRRRLDSTRASSVALLEAVAAPAASREERRARIDAVLQAALQYGPGCDSENQWCGTLDEIQRFEMEEGSGCAAVSGVSSAAFAAIAWLLSRRRSRR